MSDICSYTLNRNLPPSIRAYQSGKPGLFSAHNSTQGPSWGYLKVNCSETLSIFGDKRPRNGSKNGEMAPRTGTGYPHRGPFVVKDSFRAPSMYLRPWKSVEPNAAEQVNPRPQTPYHQIWFLFDLFRIALSFVEGANRPLFDSGGTTSPGCSPKILTNTMRPGSISFQSHRIRTRKPGCQDNPLGKCSAPDADANLRLVDFCITHLKAWQLQRRRRVWQATWGRGRGSVSEWKQALLRSIEPGTQRTDTTRF
jgi:hypothetical protein